jgi:hypothetical protein
MKDEQDSAQDAVCAASDDLTRYHRLAPSFRAYIEC